jgi:hypothetical protein
MNNKKTSGSIIIFEIYGHLIFPYLEKYMELIYLSQINSRLRRIVFSADIWNESNLTCCIDRYCYHDYCGRQKMSKTLFYSLFLQTKSIACSLHMESRDLYELIEVFKIGSYISSLHIRFRLSMDNNSSFLHPTIEIVNPNELILFTQPPPFLLQHLSVFSSTWDDVFLKINPLFSCIGKILCMMSRLLNFVLQYIILLHIYIHLLLKCFLLLFTFHVQYYTYINLTFLLI